MNNILGMISTKDLSYISDMLSWNFVLAKKALHFANEASDSEVINILNDIADMHYNHYNILLNLLNKGEQNE
ncbi:MAG: spore coat protein [Bacilli bacterium]|jgi:hypothetical protein|nr:spore coat protein [Bacilli bacterium]